MKKRSNYKIHVFKNLDKLVIKCSAGTVPAGCTTASCLVISVYTILQTGFFFLIFPASVYKYTLSYI